MDCPKCNKPNRDTALFCKWCGEGVVAHNNDALSQLVGMESIKEQLQDLLKVCQSIAVRAQVTGVKMRIGMNMCITGNTGVGKTSLVKAIQQIFLAQGIVKKPTMTLVDAADYDEFSKKTDKADFLEENIKKAKGGILVIDNAHKLVPEEESNDINKLDRLFKYMNGELDSDPIIILVGLRGLKAFMLNNGNIANRFEYHFNLPDFSLDVLNGVCVKMVEAKGLTFSDEARSKLERVLKHEYRSKDKDFGHGHFAKKKAKEIVLNIFQRDPDGVAQMVVEDDIVGTEYRKKTLDEIMQELDQYVGIDGVKEALERIVSKLDMETERTGGKSKRVVTDRFLFLGNPGTGKTTIARIFADIMNALDVLPIGQLVEVVRKDLVAGYVGQTALAVEDAVQRAMGGVLFIDEAYSLVEGENDTFGMEALNTLLTLIENHRGEFLVIAAGYTQNMMDFLSANPGMASRFNETINFSDYKGTELAEIFRRMVKANGMIIDDEAEKHLDNVFHKMYISRNPETFGNAREVRKLYEAALKNQGMRLYPLRGTPQYSPDMLQVITRVDIEGEECLQEKDIDTILAELDEFIGMGSIKKEIRELATKLEMEREMMELDAGHIELTNVHIILTGNPGTGKTTVANKMGEIFKAIGLLPSDRVVVREPKNILSSIVNQTAANMDKACREAMGATLLIDEAYNLAKVDEMGNVDEIGEQAVDALMTNMSNHAGKFVTIIAGYKDRIDRFIEKVNPGLERRFTTRLHIDDYTGDELTEIFLLNVRKLGMTLTDEALHRLRKLANQMVDAKKENFGNAGEIIKVLQQAKSRKANRLSALKKSGETLTKEMFMVFEADDIPYTEPKALNKDDYMKQLDELIGLRNVKENVKRIADYVSVERNRSKAYDKKFEGLRDHYIFVGNPGTGKTTVARIMADVLYALDVLPTNKLVETKRDELVGTAQGHSARCTREVFQRAMGGVLFIDEAYALKQYDGDMFGQEATDTLLALAENNRGKIVCIVAGYHNEMRRWIQSNSGLKSRFNKTIEFEDYNGDDMAEIFYLKAKKSQLELTPEADGAMRQYFNQLYQNRKADFANAREVNQYFDHVKSRQSTRLTKRMNEPDFKNDEFKLLILDDMAPDTATL